MAIILGLRTKISRLVEKIYPYESDCMIHRREIVRKRMERMDRIERELSGMDEALQNEQLRLIEERETD